MGFLDHDVEICKITCSNNAWVILSQAGDHVCDALGSVVDGVDDGGISMVDRVRRSWCRRVVGPGWLGDAMFAECFSECPAEALVVGFKFTDSVVLRVRRGAATGVGAALAVRDGSVGHGTGALAQSLNLRSLVGVAGEPGTGDKIGACRSGFGRSRELHRGVVEPACCSVIRVWSCSSSAITPSPGRRSASLMCSSARIRIRVISQ
jgi:hypothetical protein